MRVVLPLVSGPTRTAQRGPAACSVLISPSLFLVSGPAGPTLAGERKEPDPSDLPRSMVPSHAGSGKT
jgi:hypothetical protein